MSTQIPFHVLQYAQQLSQKINEKVSTQLNALLTAAEQPADNVTPTDTRNTQ